MIKAIIFDMDDLMINTHPVDMKVFEALLKKYGTSLYNPENKLLPKEESTFFGKKLTDILSFLREKYNLSNVVSLEQLIQDFYKLMLPICEKNVEPMPGLYKLINSLGKADYKLALASSARLEKINIILKKLELTAIFDKIISGEDEIKHGKPAPDIFLKAAEKLNVKPKYCLVLEDAQNGVEAAKRAGMRCIGVHNKYTLKKLGIKQNLSNADLQVNSLMEVNLEIIKNL